MSERFERLWLDRMPIDAEFDDLLKESRLTWENGDVFDQDPLEEDQVRKKRPRLKVLPGPEPNPLRQESGKLALTSCSSVGDVFKNLGRLAMPAQTMSLLNNRGTFFLLLVNGNPALAKTRLSLTLYQTLHREFFGSTATAG
jgi:hypothetical protein